MPLCLTVPPKSLLSSHIRLRPLKSGTDELPDVRETSQWGWLAEQQSKGLQSDQPAHPRQASAPHSMGPGTHLFPCLSAVIPRMPKADTDMWPPTPAGRQDASTALSTAPGQAGR